MAVTNFVVVVLNFERSRFVKVELALTSISAVDLPAV